MGHIKKFGALLLTLAFALGMFTVPVRAASKSPALNKTRVTLTEGGTVQLTLKNAPKGKTIRWSSSKKNVAAVTKKGKVTAKKAGTAKITAAVSKKKYTCTINVKKPTSPLTNTKGKNAADVKTLERIIKAQNAKGAQLPTDLDNGKNYKWDKGGNLVELQWYDCLLKGSLSLEGFSSLKSAVLSENKLTSLNISKNTVLIDISVAFNQLSGLDVSRNTALKYLDCSWNQLSSLDVTGNTALTELYCTENQLSGLDLTNNTKLIALCCDDKVVVTGYDGYRGNGKKDD